ncbi:MAG: protein kinase [Verrucomicrobia bacterium]|nr:protein kinase [Verrucomicrobiota bacterium]
MKPLEAPPDVASFAGRVPPQVPDHALIRCIGVGAYGEVWLARTVLGEFRAVKIVRRDVFGDDPRPFEREFAGIRRYEPISRSDPSQVAILHVGRAPDDSHFYYVMELADTVPNPNDEGRNPKETQISNAEHATTNSNLRALDFGLPSSFNVRDSSLYVPHTLRHDLKQRGRLSVVRVIEIGLSLTHALAHLHAQGLVHRDVKPSNIIFVGGRPKLADIGLVTHAATGDDARSIVGTEGYLAPEGPGTPQADLYALGKVLYEAAMGRDRRDFPDLPLGWPDVPERDALLELNEIIVKACASNARDRYTNAEELHADLELLNAGRSVKQRRAWQRTKHLATKLAAALAGLAVVSAIVYSLTFRAPRSSDFKRSPVVEANVEYVRGYDELHLNLNAAEAIKHFEKATEWDPMFADAYAQLADAWFSIPSQTSNRNGQEAAKKAVLLDPRSGLARSAFAAANVFALDFVAAERENRLAIKLSPDSEQVLLVAALNFASLGRTKEALAELRKAIDVGRHTPSKLRTIYSGFVYGWCREYDRAIELYDNSKSWLKDGVDSPHYAQSQFYLAKGDYTNSIRLGRQSALESGENPKQVKAEFDALETAFKQGGREGYWQRRLEMENSKADNQNFLSLATIHAHLNQPNKAIEYLRLAKEKVPADFAIAIYTDASFDGLRSDTRFEELLKSLWHKK